MSYKLMLIEEVDTRLLFEVGFGAMAGKVVWQIWCMCFTLLFCGTVQLTCGAPFYPANPFGEQPTLGVKSSNGRVLVAELDKPIDAVLEAMMELGGNVIFLIPPRDFEKRDIPDIGVGRGYTGQRTGKVFLGQLASNSPGGPGRRKRDTTLLQSSPSLEIPPGTRLVPAIEAVEA